MITDSIKKAFYPFYVDYEILPIEHHNSFLNFRNGRAFIGLDKLNNVSAAYFCCTDDSNLSDSLLQAYPNLSIKSHVNSDEVFGSQKQENLFWNFNNGAIFYFPSIQHISIPDIKRVEPDRVFFIVGMADIYKHYVYYG